MKCKSQQLCWSCKNAYAHKCPWFKNYTPVEGWDAEPTIIKYYNKFGEKVKDDSFLIKKCPLYEADKNCKTCKEKIKELGISERTYYRWKINGKIS